MVNVLNSCMIVAGLGAEDVDVGDDSEELALPWRTGACSYYGDSNNIRLLPELNKRP